MNEKSNEKKEVKQKQSKNKNKNKEKKRTKTQSTNETQIRQRKQRNAFITRTLQISPEVRFARFSTGRIVLNERVV